MNNITYNNATKQKHNIKELKNARQNNKLIKKINNK